VTLQTIRMDENQRILRRVRSRKRAGRRPRERAAPHPCLPRSPQPVFPCARARAASLPCSAESRGASGPPARTAVSARAAACEAPAGGPLSDPRL